MADALGGQWYRNGYIYPIYDAVNEDPPVTVVAYAIRGVMTASKRFTQPGKLPVVDPVHRAVGGFDGWWYDTLPEAQTGVDRLMAENGIADLYP